jgi:hypothetical protein
MVDVKQAVAAAIGFTKDVLEPARATDLLLEEVELGRSNGRQVWRITISVPKPTGLSNVLTAARDYKSLKVDVETGKVQSMRIRELAETR